MKTIGPGDDRKPSKSQLKRESLALQKLGEQLISMPAARFHDLPMPDTLREAVEQARGMTGRRALYRQRQYIGKLMRDIDASEIRAAIDEDEQRQRQAARNFHHIESWRDRLLTEGDSLLGELLEEFPAIDRQHVRQLIREAQRERDTEKPPRHARLLFRYLQKLAGARAPVT